MASERAAKFRAVAGAWGGLAERSAGRAWNYAAGTTVGREFGIGFAETFGFGFDPKGAGYFGKGEGTVFSRAGQYTSTGFMGWQSSAMGQYGIENASRFAPKWGMTGVSTRMHPLHGKITTGTWRQGAGRINALKRMAAQKVGQIKGAASFVKDAGVKDALKGFGGKHGGSSVFGHTLGLAFLAHSMYTGYQEGGIMGAAGGAVQFGVEWGAMRAGMALLGKVGITAGGLAPLAIAAGGAYGFYQFGEAAQEYGKQMKKLEMGAPIVDPFGTVATTRQRSLMALNNTHINGRMAMGNEGMLMHDGAYRR